MVRITLPADNEQIHAARYQLYLPTEEELRDALTREREEADDRLEVRQFARRRAPALGEDERVKPSVEERERTEVSPNRPLRDFDPF